MTVALTHDAPLTNQTAFGHNMMASMSAYLDAIVEIGSKRKVGIQMAYAHAQDALRATDNEEEQLVAQQLLVSYAALVGRRLDV